MKDEFKKNNLSKLVDDFFNVCKSGSNSGIEENLKVFYSLLIVKSQLDVNQQTKEKLKNWKAFQQSIFETTDEIYKENPKLKEDIKNGIYEIHRVKNKDYVLISGFDEFKYFLEVKE